MKGIVKLEYYGIVLRSAMYSSRRDRNTILDDWKDQLREKFYLCAIVIEPYTNGCVNKCGLNVREGEVCFEF